ncbi:MAG TPA: tRNA (adenosine(37)-N6)-dimethylallyltransferase MiaA [Terriglobia bacterium]|nr:tRNA (adenosine(37)-N6)-dimethylallyltransferase MiaA [Terriglobia bacterium]
MNAISHPHESEPAYPMLAIVGPTATGKSALALRLAELWGGEVVNFDSMQLYRGFNVGTGKLPPEERRGILHHLLDAVDPSQVFTAGDYAREAARTLASLRERAKLPILVGGTGLYLRTLLLGLFEGPGRSEELRARLHKVARRRSRVFLHRMLQRFDPQTAARIHPRDTQKVIRALEVCVLARRPFSSMLAKGRAGLQGFRTIKIGLNPDRAELNRRIDARVEAMFASGLIDEARGLFEAKGLSSGADSPRQGPFASLGYPQAAATARGELSVEEAIRTTQAATRRYAKRQRTWFRREEDVRWFKGFGDDPVIQQEVIDWLAHASLNSRGSASGMGSTAAGSMLSAN